MCEHLARKDISNQQNNSFHVLSVKKKGNPVMEIETLCNMYFYAMHSCKYPAKALMLTDKGDAENCERLVRNYWTRLK